MKQNELKVFFSILRSAIYDNKLTDDESKAYSCDILPDLLKLAVKHDVSHLLAYGLKQNRGPHAHCQGDGKQDHIVPVSQYAVMAPESGQNQSQQPGTETGQPVQDTEDCLQEAQNYQQGEFQQQHRNL